METLTAISTLRPLATKFQGPSPPPLSGTLITTPSLLGRSTRPHPLIVAASSATRKEKGRNLGSVEEERGETLLYSVAPYPLLLAALLPGAGIVRSIFDPFVELVKTWNLPDWLVHWGHPGNMAVVLFAMGGYGTYLGFRIRLSKDAEEKAKAKDLHPKLLGGMFFFFALGATGGITALLTSNKPIFESPHAVSGFIGLSLLTVQSILPVLFEENPGMRTVHGLLGSSIMTLFLIHAALGLQLGLSF
ncbi:Di-heme cytochrome, transmembrane [Cocos nucifera]|uniref:Di-heme cytochrome, transmembrane n=1 Tax=Cocos nucifera TaxID=13894 RepID=A0A8K0N5Q3_COCNU|nr:Di-heme cytochrome, transmembrane [Cocos nucifera]